ncbi:hypothetical protein OSSY52_19170 [Tepiditoga spiralis]|uniref:Uncharacterized protein n=1 Tax=Tepiditoga spiralis TaxID=2108365 RepID=A0A7G1G8M5_9BACT|nr:hypothetical protein [Tepiditoga spiralis]BBE31776.1 hypothetical protein OSSY52_19170 [Tepiditoga spiralis]
MKLIEIDVYMMMLLLTGKTKEEAIKITAKHFNVSENFIIENE